MKQTKIFNITVPELGDRPDITQVSNAIQDLEGALAGTLEVMNASIQGNKLTLVSGARTTNRTAYYEGMAIKFVAPIQINPNTLTVVTVDGLSEQTLEIPYLVNAGDSADIIYRNDKFVGAITAIQRSNAVNSTSDVTVATSLAVKTAYDKGESALQNAIVAHNSANNANANAESRVSKNGDTMTGPLKINGHSRAIVLNGGSDNATHVSGQTNGVQDWYVGRDIVGNSDISLFSTSYGTKVTLKSDRVVANKQLYINDCPVYHTGLKPTANDVGAFQRNVMFDAVPKTFNGATQVISGSPDYTDVGGGSQHFLIQMTTNDSYEQDAYVGQIAWGYSPENPKIAIRCKNPSMDGKWEPLVRWRDLKEYCPYRIGDILTTTLSGNPAEVWIGTGWEKIENCFLYAHNSAGDRGGENTIYLNTNHLPPHNHGADYIRRKYSDAEWDYHPSQIATNLDGYYAQSDITGGGAGINNMPAYYTVHVWKRIA